MVQPVFRFAPSPNGLLHLGHAYSALINQEICRSFNGKMLLRLENTDIARCRSDYEDAIVEDLAWIGFEWQGEIRRQSDHFDHYASILDDLENEDLAYPSFMSRSQINHLIAAREEKSGKTWPRDPDGGVHYPGDEYNLERDIRDDMRKEYPNFAFRLNIREAQNRLVRQPVKTLCWQEMDCDNSGKEISFERIRCEPEQWGDVVLGRQEIPASYHLACVVDDGLQGVTHVVRGRDIYPATSIHRLLQEILGITEPIYCHHDLIVDDQGNKFSKRHGQTSLRELRAAGLQAKDIHKMIGIGYYPETLKLD
ncbi:MAG: tRNA glutamyl-Q(34) synthetase GluQRS [Hyphomicrobiales bacterium]|nr:tRNA glutamyl-Q(34) synthetase GluQRS [Hyphomicrobiales bacterium]